ncbi:hypothetical protein ACFOSC_21445 [Streptantibioticus rubrisoli]|uniref:MarR family transcriptional regulator n=1 Tax=Streptantibioticus rubrisoli TaxID=1387313 RepID=A0ABT1P8G1_9ACTN|nr:hypothetical protein [Streptantibioticus rubrisoli]MCQ4040528.1 hypothetical protein [Streptantibioticus rubrisoli]
MCRAEGRRLAVDRCFELSYQWLTQSQARAFRLIAAVGEPDVSVPGPAAALGVAADVAEELLESLVAAAMWCFRQAKPPGTARLRA